MTTIIFPCEGPPRVTPTSETPEAQRRMEKSCTLTSGAELSYTENPTPGAQRNPYLFGFGNVCVVADASPISNDFIYHISYKLAFKKHITLNPLLARLESLVAKLNEYALKHLSTNSYKILQYRLKFMRENFEHDHVQHWNGFLIPRTVDAVKEIIQHTQETVKSHWPRTVVPLLLDLDGEISDLHDFANPNLPLETDAEVFSKIIRNVQNSQLLTTQ